MLSRALMYLSAESRRGLPTGAEGARGGWVFDPDRQPHLLLAWKNYDNLTAACNEIFSLKL
jgi:hypothetical protein